ncbi:MAG: peptidoglycan-binding protein, partial [Candidatus Dormibacteraeota bacterium]|nr:peptidoglycan-binding protein [Candidatus Dormibacteraeota bacterium]
MTSWDSGNRLSMAGRLLLITGVALILLLGFNAARLSVQGPTHTYAATRTLGTSQVQWDLAGLGYLSWSGVDGVYGPITTGAVKTFQSNVCITVDGIAGPQTDAALSNVVQAVQARAGATQDGLYGPQTKAAVEAYQRAHGLQVDGQAGPVTMGSMGIVRVHSCGNPAPQPKPARPVPHTPTPAPHTPTPAPPAPAPAPPAPAPAPP